ncbi:hypothetical protein ACLB2K_024869 [Fragaria x ananassa]
MACLTDVGTTIVAKLVEYTIEPVLRQVGYVICYNKNLEKLQTRVVDLGDARESMKHAVETEERKGKKIETEVQNWMTKVDQLTKEADDLNRKHLAQTECLHGFCPNLLLRHHLSRKSTKLVLDVDELLEKRNNFANIAYVAPPEVMCIRNYEAIDSRTSTATAVINELRNSNTYMIGVYGIGGVGKTTLVKEVKYQLATSGEKLFDEVVMIRDLKHDPSIERIQKEMAEKLGLELPENGTPAGRADLISNRIKDKKTLVILDDVWEIIDLEAVGLPRMATLKILLTSRTRLVLAKDMGTQKEFPLEVLNEEESWRLFQKMAGDIVEKPNIQTIATQVAEKCGGLPLLIVTVARSLKDSPKYEWNDTFRRLEEFDGEELTDKTYAAIEWSYDKLNSDELKSVFLLCASESGSDNSVDILSLLKYSMGLGFIKNADTLEKAWDALNSLLKKLQHSCLLLDIVKHGNYEWVRIHDLVKHVAKGIAARHHHVLSVSHESEWEQWPDKESCEKYTRISVKDCRTPELPEVLQCPELTMLVLSRDDDDSSREIPSNFFKEMKKLRVLDLTKWSIASLPPSLKFLKDLQTLCLDQCTLEDIALVGELQSLKILSFLKSKFKKLPKEIGQLTSLQLLDLTDCSQLEVISPDVISKLKRLEELRMGKNSFNKWEAGRVGETKRSNASLEELTCLPRLTALHIHIPDATILPANLFTTSKLERFQICIGSVWKWDDVDEALNALKLKLTSYNELDQGLKMLLKKTQDLYMEGTEDVNDKIFRELATGGYQQLKHLHVQNNAKFAYTINEKVGFLNLTWLAVSELKSLRFLLSSSMARSLSQVKRLQISGCQFMEVVISIEESNKELAENFFPQLQDLELNGLPNLTKFCSTCERLEDCTENAGICEEVEEIDSKGNLDFVIQHFLFENKGEFPNMKKLSLIGLAKLTTIWNNQVSLGSSKNLENIEIVSCDNLKSVFPASVAKSLQQLSRLKVENCGVEEIISKEDDVQTTPMFVFSKLTYVRFKNLPQLKSFYPGLHSTKWPSLLTLLVYRCTKVQIFAKGIPELKNPCTPNEQFLFLLDKDSFPNLESLGLGITENWDSPPLHLLRNLHCLISYAHTNSSLNSLEQLLGLEKVNGEIHAAGDATFPFLRQLYLCGMRKLMNLGDDSLGPARLYFPKVEILKVKDCDSLQNLRSFAISFNNLTTLHVSRCKGLKYLISISMAKSLMQLTKLKVLDCEEIIEIVASSGNDVARNEIEFKMLKHLELSALPSLRGFCSGTHTVKFPSLENLLMSGCTQLEGFILDITTDKNRLGNEIEDIESARLMQRFLFDNKVELPKLTRLTLSGLTKLTTIWNKQIQNTSAAPFDCENLEHVEIDSCENLENIFPLWVARNLQQLSRLRVKNCGVEEIISKEDDVQTTPMFVFSKLTYVRFENLPQLKSFYPGLHSTKWPSLLTLLVYGCTKVQIFAKGIPELKNPCTPNEQFLFLLDKDSFPNLESLGFGITENWDSPPLHLLRNLKSLYSYALTNDSSLNSLEQLLGLEKVNGEIHAAGDATFPFLRELYLCGMRKLMNLGDDSLGPARLYFPKVEILRVKDCDSLQNLRSFAISFNNLTTLHVSRCKGLKYLISISMAKSLMQLTKLKVRDCEEMIEIVASSGNDVARNEIEFKMLKHLELSALPSLKGFCSGTHTVKFPSLENLLMSGCTQLEGFILDITTDKNRLGNEIEDIESARLMQRFLFDNKVELPKLTRLTLSGLTKLTTIWNKQIQNTSAAPFDCENLEHVMIDSCENLENIFPLWVARNLQQLQTLVVMNCGVKEIVAREERLQTVFKFVFPKVTRVHFENLSELINFYPGMHVCSWPLLNDLGVFECDKVDIFAEEFSSFQEKLDGNSSSTLTNRQFLFSIEKDSFPNLERLSLNAMEFSNGPLPAAAQFFGKLKKLDVCCPKSKSLVFLDKLVLDPEGSSTASAVGITTQQFPHLKELRLVRMKKLMHLGQGDEEDNSQSATRIPNIPNLQTLIAIGCDSLRNLRSSAISFDNLTTLQVSFCDRLEYLITYSMANSLTQLTTLEVEGCPRLVQIVGSNDEDDSRNEITLPRLKHLKLSVLPRLQSFCSGNCLAKLPSLETSTMSNRLKLKIFAADDQTLQLITNEGDDTDVEFWEEWIAADDEMNSASTDLIS